MGKTFTASWKLFRSLPISNEEVWVEQRISYSKDCETSSDTACLWNSKLFSSGTTTSAPLWSLYSPDVPMSCSPLQWLGCKGSEEQRSLGPKGSCLLVLQLWGFGCLLRFFSHIQGLGLHWSFMLSQLACFSTYEFEPTCDSGTAHCGAIFRTEAFAYPIRRLSRTSQVQGKHASWLQLYRSSTVTGPEHL